MELRNKIEKYQPYNEQEEKDKQTMLKYIDTFEDVLTRNNEFGHFTASSWVINKERTKVLMIYHNIYKSWACTGGHADGEINLLETAIRELKEETGVENVKVLDELEKGQIGLKEAIEKQKIKIKEISSQIKKQLTSTHVDLVGNQRSQLRFDG